MDEQLTRLEAKLAELDSKIDKVYASTEKMRKIFLWSFIITVGCMLLPLLILPLVLPLFLSSLTLPPGF